MKRILKKNTGSRTSIGWLIPVSNAPWHPGYFGKCPYCGEINVGMQEKPTKYCPHCGKKVVK